MIQNLINKNSRSTVRILSLANYEYITLIYLLHNMALWKFLNAEQCQFEIPSNDLLACYLHGIPLLFIYLMSVLNVQMEDKS